MKIKGWCVAGGTSAGRMHVFLSILTMIKIVKKKKKGFLLIIRGQAFFREPRRAAAGHYHWYRSAWTHCSVTLAGLVHASSTDRYACSRWSRAVRFSRQQEMGDGRGEGTVSQSAACVCAHIQAPGRRLRMCVGPGRRRRSLSSPCRRYTTLRPPPPPSLPPRRYHAPGAPSPPAPPVSLCHPPLPFGSPARNDLRPDAQTLPAARVV